MENGLYRAQMGHDAMRQIICNDLQYNIQHVQYVAPEYFISELYSHIYITLKGTSGVFILSVIH